MTELRLPPAPPLPPDVRERVLRRVLADDAGRPVRPAAMRRRAPFVAAAAAVVVAVAATTVTALTGFGSDDPATLDRLPPAAADGSGTGTPRPDPFAGVDLPPPSGEPATDEALARCAAAVVHSGRAAEYPPTREWRATLHMGSGAVESDLLIDDAFACLVTPRSVAVSGLTGTPAGPVQVVRMSPGRLVVLNPEQRAFRIGPPEHMRMSEDKVTVIDGYDVPPAQMRLQVAGYDGPVPDPAPALTVVDRDLPDRPDTPDGRELGSCLSRLPAHTYTAPELWTPVGWHDPGGTAPRALVARIGDVAVGYCVVDPVDGPVFTGAPLPAADDTAQPIAYYRGGGKAILLLVPPDVTRVAISSATAPVPSQGAPVTAGCTILQGFAMCTLDTRPVEQAEGPDVVVQVVVTAFTADDPTGTEVYRN